MAYAEFYNLNSHINYPFITTGTDTFRFQSGGTMPNDLIVDCGFTIGPRMEYDPEIGAVYLYSVTRNSPTLVLTFRVYPLAPGASVPEEIVFARNVTAGFGETSYEEAAGGPLYGVGFLVTGNISTMYDALAEGETKLLMEDDSGYLPKFEATVEPALVVSLRKHAVCSVSVGNMLRLEDGPCDGCGTPPPVPDDHTVKLQADAEQMIGNIRFRPGYNTAITVNKASQSLSFAAVIGEGLGEACDVDLVRYVGDIPDLGDRCKDFIFTINGITPNAAGAFLISGGGSFVVNPVGIGDLVINSRLGNQMVCGGAD